MTPEIPIVLQARMGSTRLPGKVLMPLAGRPLIEHCIVRLRAAGTGRVVLATTTNSEDDRLADFAASLGVPVVRGPSDDVLQRFVLAADYLNARFLVRATGDNPAVDIDGPRRVADALLACDADHAVDDQLPCGAAVEVLRTSALYQAAAETNDAYDREHVTPFLYRNPSRFRAIRVETPEGLRRPTLRLTVDTPADLSVVRALLERVAAYDGLAPLASIIKAADELSVAVG